MRGMVGYLSVLVLLAACGREPPPVVEAPRPVTVLVLEERDPVEPLLLSGSVRAWQEQEVAFEVEGTVQFVAEPSTNLAGRWVENGKVQMWGLVNTQQEKAAAQVAAENIPGVTSIENHLALVPPYYGAE